MSQHTRSRAATRGSGLLVTYLITFACYGCHMHGDEAGSVDRKHDLPGSRLIQADPKRVLDEKRWMDQAPYGLDRSRREAVLAAIVDSVRRGPAGRSNGGLRGDHIRRMTTPSGRGSARAKTRRVRRGYRRKLGQVKPRLFARMSL